MTHTYDIHTAFDRDMLARICEMPETAFQDAYGMTRTRVSQPEPEDFYLHLDNGSDTLAVAHLDTVGLAHQRTCRFVDTEAGEVVFSRALDDRLGAYIVLELLPALGVNHDILLTVGEESGLSTAAFFKPEKEYNSMIEFDRGGTDVVMYQYEDVDTVDLVEAAGAVVGEGSFSDICFLDHLGVKGFNWGVGYRDYHGPRAHAYLEDTFRMMGHYLDFHELTDGLHLPHRGRTTSGYWWEETDTAGGTYDAQDVWEEEHQDDSELWSSLADANWPRLTTERRGSWI